MGTGGTSFLEVFHFGAGKAPTAGKCNVSVNDASRLMANAMLADL